MTFPVLTVIALGQVVVGFYGFWFVWRLLLPVLPGPADESERIARFACYFTDPLVTPLATRLRVDPRWLVLTGLVAVAATQVGLQEATAAL